MRYTTPHTRTCQSHTTRQEEHQTLYPTPQTPPHRHNSDIAKSHPTFFFSHQIEPPLLLKNGFCLFGEQLLAMMERQPWLGSSSCCSQPYLFSSRASHLLKPEWRCARELCTKSIQQRVSFSLRAECVQSERLTTMLRICGRPTGPDITTRHPKRQRRGSFSFLLACGFTKVLTPRPHIAPGLEPPF